MKKYVILVAILQAALVHTQDISFIRYYANDKDFIANVPMKASNRRGYDHIAAYFNDRNLPVKVEYYLSNGSLNKREVMEYNKEKELIRKGEVNSKGQYIKLVVYSNNEPWSQEYQKSNYSKKERINFTDQRSTFLIPRGEHVTQIIFETVDGLQYGKIELDYDYCLLYTSPSPRD